MSPVILEVVSSDSTFVDFYERLAHSLGDAGTVYTPHPVIPPNIRMAVPSPTEVMITLESADVFAKLYEAIEHYLEGHDKRRLTLLSGGRSMGLAWKELPDEATLARALLAGATEEDLGGGYGGDS